ncbi:unnamed protein product [Cylicocyclus nassatus]|uniref:STPR domain-containing protein n=1 Tax=Cylicocyclus nassatus TaxID=53992 RepID=A0AA36GMI1_CYLNA|nr:unnamed protein product [Cylicocyclus nassatus]
MNLHHLPSGVESAAPDFEQDLAETIHACEDAEHLETRTSTTGAEIASYDFSERAASGTPYNNVDKGRLLLTAVAKRSANRRANETEEERKLRLSKLAMRARVRRSTESEEEKSIRLQRVAERAKTKRKRAAEGGSPQNSLPVGDTDASTSISASDNLKGNGIVEASRVKGVPQKRNEDFACNQCPSTSRGYDSETSENHQLALPQYTESLSEAFLNEEDSVVSLHLVA